MAPTPRFLTALVFALVVAVGGYQIRERLEPQKVQRSIAGGYVHMAHHLVHMGVASTSKIEDGPPARDVRREPLYPLALAGLMKVSPSFAADGIRCIGPLETEDCLDAYRPVARLSFAFFMGAAVLVGLALRGLGVGLPAAALGVALVAFNEPAAKQVPTVRLEPLAVLAMALCSYLLVGLGRHRSAPWAAAVGVGTGLAALTKAQYLYLFPLSLVVVAIATATGGGRVALRRSVLSLLLCAVGFGATAGVWMARNHALIGVYAIVEPGRAMGPLAARVHYNRMTPEEWRASFSYWGRHHPGLDDLPREDWWMLSRSNRDGHYKQSTRDFKMRYQEARDAGHDHLEAAGIVQSYYLGQMWEHRGAHLWVTVPMIYRLLQADEFWKLTFPRLLLAGLIALFRRDALVLLALAPGVYSFAFHAFLSHAKTRYGPPAVPALAIGLPLLVDSALVAVRGRLAARRGDVSSPASREDASSPASRGDVSSPASREEA